MDKVIDFINVNRDRYLDELKALLAIPSISALPEHAADVKRCAEWCAGEMRRIGLQNVQLLDTPGNPVVYGDWLGAPGRPTILFYGHYDVQPVDALGYFQADLRGSSTDLPSGAFGGAVANPAFVLAQMIAQMKDRGGRVKIPGFYDDVRPLQEAERQAWASLPFNERKYRKDFGV